MGSKIKQSNSITLDTIVNKRQWNEELIPVYLGIKPLYDKSEVIRVEGYLTKIGIEFKQVK